MPKEWLIILQAEKGSLLAAYNQLENMTVSQVYDVLEAMEMERMYKLDEYQKQLLERQKNAR